LDGPAVLLPRQRMKLTWGVFAMHQLMVAK